jgi:hypothetical protein
LALIAALVYFARVLKKYNNNRANIAQDHKITILAYSELEGVSDHGGRPVFKTNYQREILRGGPRCKYLGIGMAAWL